MLNRTKWLILVHLTLAFSPWLGQVTAGETVEEAAIIARSLVDSSATSIGSMATIYPSDHPTNPGAPFSLQEYYSSCHPNGSLTLLILPISQHGRNIIHSPSGSASISVWSEPYPGASKPRVSLIGNVTIFQKRGQVPDLEQIQACYLQRHPDAQWWIPGDQEAHVAYWARFDPQSIYFVGGFGGQHYIGSIPLLIYQRALPSHANAGDADLGMTAKAVLVEQNVATLDVMMGSAEDNFVKQSV